jgi:hypothetical protein
MSLTGGSGVTNIIPPVLNGATVTISSGGSLSAAIDLANQGLVRIVMPAGWDAAVITLQSSFDGVTYNNLYDQWGGEYTIQAAASRSIVLVPADFVAMRYIKLRSGTSGTPVNQTADRIITILSRLVL